MGGLLRDSDTSFVCSISSGEKERQCEEQIIKANKAMILRNMHAPACCCCPSLLFHSRRLERADRMRDFVFDDLILVNLLPFTDFTQLHEQHENRSERRWRRVVRSFSSYWRDSDTSFTRNQLGRRIIPKRAAVASLGLQMG
jgi:hypothetical protein